jgi:hypothetical protein
VIDIASKKILLNVSASQIPWITNPSFYLYNPSGFARACARLRFLDGSGSKKNTSKRGRWRLSQVKKA